MNGKVAVLTRKIERILSSSYDWNAWHGALDTLLHLEREPSNRRLLFCVDSSEVVEFLRPASLLRDDVTYPTLLDLSLLSIFRPSGHCFILPHHQKELEGKRRSWADRLRQIELRVTLVHDALTKLKSKFEELDRGADEQMLDEFVQFILRERGVFLGLFFGPTLGRHRTLDWLRDRLSVLGAGRLDLEEGWFYRPDEDRINEWYQRLKKAKSAGGPASHLIDAHALHLLEQLNEALPDDQYLILYTHSNKVWQALDDWRRTEPKTLQKKGVSLIQWPHVALVKQLLAESSASGDAETLRKRLILERERAQSLRDLRRRVEQEILPYLEQEDLGKLDLQEVSQLVAKLEQDLRKLDSVANDRQRLERLQMALESDFSPEEAPLLTELMAALRGNKRKMLQEILQQKRTALLADLRDLQQGLSVAASTTPDPSLSFIQLPEEPTSPVRAILRSKPGGTAYVMSFQDDRVEAHLMRLQELLRTLDTAKDRTHRERISLDLQREMYQCEVRLGGVPEFHLLLATVYSSRQMWFQAFDAADQGLKKLWPERDPERDGTPSRERAWAITELLLVKGLAFLEWTRERYADLKVVTADFLGEAAELCRTSLRLQQKWTSILDRPPQPDPRCLRELATIYGTCAELGIPLKVQAEDWLLASLPSELEPTLPDLFLAFSRAAYRWGRWGRDEDRMRVYYQNSLLYALTKRDHDTDIEERQELAGLFARAEETREDPNFLDTLAWHHYVLAMRDKRQGVHHAPGIQRAKKYIGQAWKRVRKHHRYFHWLIAGHREAILEEAEILGLGNNRQNIGEEEAVHRPGQGSHGPKGGRE